MAKSNPITFISDEVSPSLTEAIDFAQRQGMTQLELRSVGGVNLMDLDLEQIREIATTIHQAGLTVANLASPLLKWLPPGKVALMEEVNFHGYQLETDQVSEVFAQAFAIADILQTPSLRIFSYLKYADFQFADLEADMTALLSLAEQHDKTLLIENEPVCNLDSLPQVAQFLADWNHPRLRALLDLGNLYQSGYLVTDAELLQVAPYVKYVHLKDFSTPQGTYVPLGEGSVQYQVHLKVLKPWLQEASIPFSMETHVQKSPMAATEASIRHLNALLAAL
ncbi:hypothetical protein BST81_13040 [Leptolyngbya sp. 'hensonii']|uniref:sugar phosphate isomerase/epimerase family protein n=1 Tax=Leptolyngbya sp. 'hensonii' TaxID=1922337 RepID=UPI000950120B|nr:TIM barrel protein [Leptolyngbya sp. 'hensonii']OLP17970.1 hypothetical protein BST81_13040 [Leptolyngbya sp. 'hensonii']